MRREAPADAAALERVEAADIVVVDGCYDHVEQVLSAIEMPFTRISPDDVAAMRLRPHQLLIVNCPGQIGERGAAKVRSFVREGGSLFTTDWALRHVIEPAFPGFAAYNERPTADDVVRIEIVDQDNPLLAGVIEAADDPQWWLEGSSYPIRVLDTQRVEVLIRSDELEQKWGEAAVAISFRYGLGDVLHMISHYFLQRTELRNQRHQRAAPAYFAEKGVGVPAPMAAQIADLTVGDVESAATSSRVLANVIARKKRTR
jgi:hypothetical protein